MADRPLSIDIRHPLLLKANDLVLLTREDGEIVQDVPGFGLFYRDTCYLAAYALRLHGTEPLLLMSSDEQGCAAGIALANRGFLSLEGRGVADHQISIRRSFVVVDDKRTIWNDTISFCNFGAETLILPIALQFSTLFESMFVLRGASPGKRGVLHAPQRDGNVLRFCYEGADAIRRTLLVLFSFSPELSPCTSAHTVAQLELKLEPRIPRDLTVEFQIDERPTGDAVPQRKRIGAGVLPLARKAEARLKAARTNYARVESGAAGFAEAVSRSLSDLAILEVRRGPHRFTAAGAPWFVGLFGRDSLLPAIQCLAFNPDLAPSTVKALAHWQGVKNDPVTREEPGKILHELRVGELAHLGEVSQTPSYAAVDSTLLFLIAIARHISWTGDMSLFDDLGPNIDRALDWLTRKTEELEFGYVAYEGLAKGQQPINQSWRDSGKGVLRKDGTYPTPPLALVEVQGYAYEARTRLSPLFRRRGETAKADRLAMEARALRERFLRDFWMRDEGCYCLALEREGRQVASVASNAAQVLWTGIASTDHAHKIATRIMKADMFSGWGVRTLSADHPAFDPLAYQQGSVWPFDNALMVSGLRRYGQDDTALRIMTATLDAAASFRLRRLPEFFAGAQRLPGDAPMHAPRADPLQAWSAATIPFMTTELLGLSGDGFAKRLHIRRPSLPDGVDGLSLHDLRVGGTSVSLRFTRKSEGVHTAVVHGGKDLEVIIEDGPVEQCQTGF